MGIFKLGTMTLGSLFKKAPTRRYPHEKRESFERTRGQIDMVDIENCIFCGLCARKCPADAIAVDRKESRWEYWPFKCVACDSCVRACPKSDLKMLKERPAVGTDNKISVVHELTVEQKAEKKRQEEEKKAKILSEKKAKRNAGTAEYPFS